VYRATKEMRGEQEAEAVRKEDGVFDISAPWISAAEPMDLVFRLKLPNDEDILTGRLEKKDATIAAAAQPGAGSNHLQQTIYVAVGALMAGVLLTLLIGASISRRRLARFKAQTQMPTSDEPGTESEAKVKQLRRATVAVLALLSALEHFPI
jgi:hypothetical protein